MADNRLFLILPNGEWFTILRYSYGEGWYSVLHSPGGPLDEALAKLEFGKELGEVGEAEFRVETEGQRLAASRGVSDHHEHDSPAKDEDAHGG